MADLNHNLSFIDDYLRRCTHVQKQADSDPMYQPQLPTKPKEQTPVIVLDDDEDEATERNLQQLENLATYVNEQRTNCRITNTSDSSDLHITGVSMLREWIDISELDVRSLKDDNLKESERTYRYRNSQSQSAHNDHRNTTQGLVTLRNCLRGKLTPQNEERRNGQSAISNQNKDVENNKTAVQNIDLTNDNEPRKTEEKSEDSPNGGGVTLLRQILEGQNYATSKNDEHRKPQTEDTDMTWADLNVEEDIDSDEENKVVIEVKNKNEEPEGEKEETECLEIESEAQNEDNPIEHEENGNSGRYKCSYCPYRTAWKSNMTKHVVSRHKRNEEIHWYQCAHCPYRGKTREYIRIHLRLKHEQFITWFHCPTCPFKFKSKQLLQSHVLAMHTAPEDIKWFECDQCEFKCKFKQRLKYHKINRHLGENEIRWYQCKDCPYKGKCKKGLNKHILNKHTDYDQIQMFKCQLCPSEYRENSKLNAHVRKQHSKEAESKRFDAAEEELECKMCGFKTMSKTKYQEHFNFDGVSCYWRINPQISEVPFF